MSSLIVMLMCILVMLVAFKVYLNGKLKEIDGANGMLTEDQTQPNGTIICCIGDEVPKSKA